MRRRRAASDPVAMLGTAPSPQPMILAHATRALTCAVALAVGFTFSAWVTGLGPLDGTRGEPSPAERTIRALPFDAPVPAAAPDSAGEGADLPYRAEWTLPEDALAVIEAI